jgi:division protein CdvB (Snf7/Vps24/ESCRT-III family)
MSAIEQSMLETFRVLPLEKQQEALKFVEELGRENTPPRIKLFAEIDEIVSAVPLEEWAELPADGAANVDHYLYGAAKKQ